MENKKPFKETGLGKFLLGAGSTIIDTIGDVLPDKGILGVVKDLIDKDPDLTEEQKNEAQDRLVRLYKLEVEDRDSARKREAAIVKAGGKDWMMSLTGVIGLAAFAFLVYTVVTTSVPENNKEIFIHTIGIVEGVALSIFGYYYGSAVKQDK
jgi:hypothetical protein